jgi:hypothetical protein
MLLVAMLPCLLAARANVVSLVIVFVALGFIVLFPSPPSRRRR